MKRWIRQHEGLVYAGLLLLLAAAIWGVPRLHLLVPWEPTEPPREEWPWGITMSVRNVTPTGATLVCSQAGDLPEGAQLITGARYLVRHWYRDQWRIPEDADENKVWVDIGYMVKNNGESSWDIGWEYIYGRLEPGWYRLGKEITLLRAPGDYTTKVCWATFEIK